MGFCYVLVRVSRFNPSNAAEACQLATGLNRWKPSHFREVFESRMGAVLETYVVNALDADYYFREGKKEIDIILRDDELLPVEVRETVYEDDIDKFAGLVKYVNAKRGVVVTSNQEIKREEVEVIPVYLTESVHFTKKVQK